MAKRKNPAAVALAKHRMTTITDQEGAELGVNAAAVELSGRRMKTMTAKERAEVARKGGAASKAKLTPEQRSEIARKAGLAGGRGRKKAE